MPWRWEWLNRAFFILAVGITLACIVAAVLR